MPTSPRTDSARLFILFLIATTGLVACNRQATPSTANPTPPTLTAQELALPWTEAATHLTLSSDSQTTPHATLQYVGSPDCALIYDFEVTTTTAKTTSPTPPTQQITFRNRPQTQQILGRFELQTTSDPSSTQSPTWNLHARQIGQYSVRNEVRLPGKESQNGELEDVLLQNLGNELQTHQNNATLWNQLHPFGGLAQFFPRLPAPNASDTPQSPDSPTLRITERILIDDQPAIVLLTTTEPFTARYVMLTSGQLLHAATSHSRQIPTEHGDFTRTQRAEARLTGACNGPTLPPIGQKTSRNRHALETYTRLVFAIHGNHTDRALPFLSQDLLDAHGAENIFAMLKNHIDHYGISALGDPRLIDPVESDGHLLRFRVAGRAENTRTDPENNPVTVINHITIEDSESGMRILSIASTTQQTSQDWNMLEISPRRIFTASIPPTP